MATVQRLRVLIFGGVYCHVIPKIVNMHAIIMRNKFINFAKRGGGGLMKIFHFTHEWRAYTLDSSTSHYFCRDCKCLKESEKAEIRCQGVRDYWCDASQSFKREYK